MLREGTVHRGGPVGSGPLVGKVGDGGTHPGGAAPTRAERTMVRRCLTDAEVLRSAPMDPEVPTIPKGEGEGEARFNRNSKPRGGRAH
jgi:hypothetical protein